MVRASWLDRGSWVVAGSRTTASAGSTPGHLLERLSDGFELLYVKDEGRPSLPEGIKLTTIGEDLIDSAGFSFPSGHTMAATVFYGTLVCYLLTRITATGARIAIVAVAVLMIAIVAMSRIYLGAHFLSEFLLKLSLAENRQEPRPPNSQ